MKLVRLLDEQKDEIIADALSRLGSAELRHYEASSAACNEDRLRALFDVAHGAVRERTMVPAVAYAEQLARERFAAGFGLHEVHAAIGAVEAAIWHAVARNTAPEEYPQSFATTSTVLGAIKEALAVEYVRLASESRMPALDLVALLDAV